MGVLLLLPALTLSLLGLSAPLAVRLAYPAIVLFRAGLRAAPWDWRYWLIGVSGAGLAFSYVSFDYDINFVEAFAIMTAHQLAFFVGAARPAEGMIASPDACYPRHMCRSIKTLREGARLASDDEVAAAALQFVRKVSGFRQPAARNAAVFDAAVEEIAASTRRLLDSLQIGGRATSRAS